MEQKVVLNKIAGTENPADVLTKYVGAEGTEKALRRMSVGARWRPLSRRLRPRWCAGNHTPETGPFRGDPVFRSRCQRAQAHLHGSGALVGIFIAHGCDHAAGLAPDC